jgi:hypothetical protein
MPPADEELRRERVAAMYVLALDAALAEAVQMLDARGVQSILLKGVGTARWLYDHPHERPYGDIDLLVPPSQFESASDTLQQHGFRLPELSRVAHHEVLVRGRISIELHRTLMLLSAPEDLVWQLLSINSQRIDVGGVAVRVPSTTAAALIVVLHAIQHGRERSKPMQDLEQAVQRVDFATWQRAATLSSKLGAEPIFAAGLRLTPVGVELADRLQLPVQPVSRLIHLRAMTPPDTAGGIERLVTTPGLAPRLAQVAHELIPSPAFMRIWKPMARRGRLGLTCAYIWRPFWLVVKLPEGIRAWRQASRNARKPGQHSD